MNSQGTGEKNNDERTIRRETNETKSKESTNPVTIFQQKPNLQKNKDERTIRQETNETKQKKNKNKKVQTQWRFISKSQIRTHPSPTLVGEIRLCAC